MLITVNIQIFIIIVLFILTKQIKIYSILMIFTLIHELAHMCAGMILKLRPKELKINPFGISILFETYEKPEKNKILIALAGPSINLIIALVCLWINIESEIKEIIIYSNILLGTFNLIPIYPLDGGQILKSILKKTYNYQEREEFIHITSNILVILLTAISSVLVLIYHNIGILLVLVYIWSITIKENKKYILKSRVYKAIEEAKKLN